MFPYENGYIRKASLLIEDGYVMIFLYIKGEADVNHYQNIGGTIEIAENRKRRDVPIYENSTTGKSVDKESYYRDALRHKESLERQKIDNAVKNVNREFS